MPSEVISIEPLTRVGGALGARAEIDGERITDAHIFGNAFRGYEPITTGRDPRDALMCSSRSCGWCGGVHETTASMAVEMTWGIRPPPMAMALRSIAQATEAIWVQAAHLAVRAGPDYCAGVVKDSTPWLWDTAMATEAPRGAIHGYDTIAAIMEAMTPVTGKYWYQTIPVGRRVLEMINMMCGKYPHPSTLSPGGVGSTLTLANFTEYYTRLYKSVDYVKQVVALWDDLLDFMAEADPRFADQGESPANFIHAGAWDDPVEYEGSFESLDTDGRMRLAVPGAIVDGQHVTGSLRDVQDGVEEYVDRSFYRDWGGGERGGLSPRHPFNKTTIAAPEARALDGRYSWCAAPRWRGNVMETSPLGRLWLTALRTDFPENEFIETTGRSVRILIPGNFLPETIVEWHIPQRVTMLERLRAEAYGVAFAGLCAAISLLRGLEYSRMHEYGVSTPFEVLPGEREGVGLYESGLGMNAHWMRTVDGRISTYQIIGASTWNASPRDGQGNPGPIEQALIGSPIIEEGLGRRRKGVDVARIVHSFDPCMQCATH